MLFRTHFIAFFVVAVLQIQHCSVQEHQNAGKSDYVTTLPDPKTFNELSGKPLSGKYGQVDEVKVVYSLATKQLYFVNSWRYPLHFDFCSNVLGYSRGLGKFNENNYSDSNEREYYLCGVNHYQSKNIYTLEFVGEDAISSIQIRELYQLLSKYAFFGDSLKILINTDHLMELNFKNELSGIPLLSPEFIYGNQQYQGVITGETYGYLRKIEKKEFGKIQPHDIVMIHSSPNELPVCAAVISTQFQTPLSHINILCHNRGTPLCTYIKAWESPALEPFLNQLVKFSVMNDTFKIEAAVTEDAIKFWKKNMPAKLIRLKADLSVNWLVDISVPGYKSMSLVGAKAANFGELMKIQKKSKDLFYTPEGAFGIPFFFYDQHIQHEKIQTLIHQLLSDSLIRFNPDSLKEKLKEIRKAIRDEPLSISLLVSVTDKIKSAGAGNAFRFRSSTNAEDISGFNGAGLYDSKTGVLNDSAKSVENAIKEVWSSVWTLRAFQEREYYGIDHQTVYMGILVHRSFPDEIANGVAITKNLYRNNFPGFTINVQLGEVSVVSPPDSVICDQFVCMSAADINQNDNQVVAEYSAMSSLNHNQAILSKEQITRLYKALDFIKHYYYEMPGYPIGDSYESFGLDLEFKFDKNGKLYIKQVRPFD